MFVAACAAASCGGGPVPPSSPAPGPIGSPQSIEKRVVVGFSDHLVTSEVADEPAEQAIGLMNRTSLDQDAGMLFLFERRQSHGFYMKNTLIPLSIAYMRGVGRGRYEVVAILDMTPCPPQTVTCPTYPPGAAYDSALEVNRGWFSDNDVNVGDIATIDSSL